ncbi:hypothetical protein GCM10023205_74020 [Yinghuangia aomiensis]|uniref:Uncharacterized protein n=1 Tax=Yinghuangia aomiensis TaxID=676205 RepID=A0ABP9I837_9ACTN
MPKKAPKAHVYSKHQHGDVTHVSHDGQSRLVWNAETKKFDVQVRGWVTVDAWNLTRAYGEVREGWDAFQLTALTDPSNAHFVVVPPHDETA